MGENNLAGAPYLSLEDIPAPSNLPRLAVAIGVFDGVHRGHRALVEQAAQLAGRSSGVHSAVLTFDPPPAALFAPGGAAPLLGTLEERAALLRQAGAEYVIVAHFDRTFADQLPEEFVQSVLMDRLRAAAVITGPDFCYGRNRTGTVASLETAGLEYGFEAIRLSPIEIEGMEARSTTIRELLLAGKPVEAAALLGRPYTLWGEVVHGRKLGRTIGFPTANLEPAPGVLVPAAGVYAGRVRLGEEVFPAAISVGNNPTVAPDGVELPRTVEAYILGGFDRDIYGERIGIDFVAYLRGMVRFDGLEPLVAQMNADVEATRLILAANAGL